jgi:hypothetical protein
MPYLPPRPEPGKPIPKGYFGLLWDYIRSLEPKPVAPILVKHNDGGTIFSFQRNASSSAGGSAGAEIYWAKPTAIISANSYTCSIYTDDNDTTPIETGKAVYVRDITDSLSVGDPFPVKATSRTGFDYAAVQQLGDL